MNLVSLPVALMAAVCLYAGFYHFWIFCRRREAKVSLTFAFMCFSITLYDIFCVGLYNAADISVGMFWQRLQFAGLSLLSLSIIWFVYYFTEQRKIRFFCIISLFYLVLLILGLIIRNELTLSINNPMPRQVQMGNFIQVTYNEVDPGIIHVFQFNSMLIGFIYLLYLLVQYYRAGNKSYTRPILISMVIFFLACVNDGFIASGVYDFIYMMEYAYMIIVLSMAYVLLNRYVDMFKEVEELNVNLEKNIKELEKAEAKYRNLVEGSDEIIFSLDENFSFISVNSAIKKHLGFSEENVLGKSFLFYIQDTWHEKSGITRSIVEEYLKNLKKTKDSVSFRTEFITGSYIPKEMLVKIEYVEIENKKERFLGKASSVTDDIMLDFMVSESYTYEAGNYLKNIELLSHRLTQNLVKFLPKDGVTEIRLSLREILINAIEHGNLNIDFEEKTAAKEEGRYLEFIKERQMDPENQNKRVHIEYSLNNREVVYTITDEGKGFDYEAMEKYFLKAQGENLPHGRGLILAKDIFDDVRFNTKGNQVVLVKRFNL